MSIDARAMWVRFETYHDVTYFTPESRAATDALGCKGGWMGYFGMRAAPLGAVSPELVTALFYNFAPSRVGRALPDAWSVASPSAYLRTRLSGADAALRRLLPADVLEGADLAEAAALLRSAASHAPTAGRALAAANAALPWPSEPHLVLWQAATLLRESRGDGHVAALVSAGLDPCETLVLFGAEHGLSEDYMRAARGWSESEWSDAQGRLTSRGLLTATGLTEAGAALRAWAESRTDEGAALPWHAIGEQATARAATLLTPIALRIAQGNEAMAVNPMALDPVAELIRLSEAGDNAFGQGEGRLSPG
ncbi:SCO6745 family protein [Flindersiella endophytica]